MLCICYVILTLNQVYVWPNGKHNKTMKYHEIPASSISDSDTSSTILEIPLCFSDFKCFLL